MGKLKPISDKPLNIFQLSIMYQQLFDVLSEKEDAGEEVDYDKELERVKDAIINKLGNFGYHIKHLESRLKVITEERKRIQELEKRLAKQIERKKEFLKTMMQKNDTKRVQFGSIIIKIRNNRPKIVIVDEDSIPEKYKTVVQEIKISKNDIYSDVQKNGVIPDGIEIEPSTSLIIN